MKRAIIIAWRELRNFLQDRGDLAFSLLLPIATFALIYGAFGGQELFHATAYVVNEDPGGAYADKLIQRINEQGSVTVQTLFLADAQAKLDRSDLTLVLVIPAGFSDKLNTTQPAQLTFMQRGNGGQDGQVVAAVVRGAADSLNQDLQAQGQVTKALATTHIPTSVIATTTQHWLEREQELPLVGVEETPVGGNPNAVAQYLPGIVTMYVLFSISIAASGLVEERRKGTLERLLTTRLTVGELFTGKFLSGTVRGLAQTFILLSLSYAVFQIFTPITFLESLLVAVTFAMAGSAIGLVIASVVRTADAATWVGVFFTMAMTMLGGTFFSISKGSALYTLSKLSINGYANDAFKKLITEGRTLSGTGQDFAVMAGVMVVGLVLSRLFFKAVPQGK